nr:hypothetical protein [Mycobacterium lepromatosis]
MTAGGNVGLVGFVDFIGPAFPPSWKAGPWRTPALNGWCPGLPARCTGLRYPSRLSTGNEGNSVLSTTVLNRLSWQINAGISACMKLVVANPHSWSALLAAATTGECGIDAYHGVTIGGQRQLQRSKPVAGTQHVAAEFACCHQCNQLLLRLNAIPRLQIFELALSPIVAVSVHYFRLHSSQRTRGYLI